MILLIDSYDSFSHNLKRLIENETNEKVAVVQNDFVNASEYMDCFKKWTACFQYIVIGPGPGNPENKRDVGIIGWIFEHIRENPDDAVPILGVCLGFQSLCHAFGNQIKRLPRVRHGQIYQISTKNCELFEGFLATFPSVRYHSLGIHLNEMNDKIIPLASCDDDGDTIVMAGGHPELPLFGVQYHPESICSEGGSKLVQNFHKIAKRFNESKGRLFTSSIECPTNGFPQKVLEGPDEADLDEGNHTLFGLKLTFENQQISPIELCEALRKDGQEIVLLNSASEPGNWSIVGLPIEGRSLVITHSVDRSNKVLLKKFGDVHSTERTIGSIWDFLRSEMEKHSIPKDFVEKEFSKLSHRSSPFCGGFVGLISYEEGQNVDHLNLEAICSDYTPDLKLIFIERALLYDHTTREWIILSIKPDDEKWLSSFIVKVKNLDIRPMNQTTVPASVKTLCYEEDKDKIVYDFPDREMYRKQFEKCQEYLHSGDSYELCLTTQLRIVVPSYIDPWELYKILAVHKNPSPYSSYMSFDDCVLLSSSPERFLSWKNDTSNTSKKIELRPIKGTVRNDESVTKEVAERLLKTPKEMGENLMIVDLIRHDLDPFVKSVEVSSLMAVETYKTVYQLVSVIQGNLEKSSGLDVLQYSLPPGSMTGAPKKRSVELLSSIESQQDSMKEKRRGIYSGVAGYWSVTDEADWSVTIRSIFHYKNDLKNTETTNVWRIGAGGAITVLSEEEAEWEEMSLKLSSTLMVFE